MARIKFEILNKTGFDISCGNASIDSQAHGCGYLIAIRAMTAYKILSEDNHSLGCVGLTFRSLSPEDFPDDEEIHDLDIGGPLWLYGVEIKFLAISSCYQHHGIGTAVMTTLIKNIQAFHNQLPISFIYIDALSGLESWYEKLGFSYLSEKGSTVTPMYISLVDLTGIEDLLF